MDSNPDVELIHDEEAAVKYMTWDTNQWISFDDAESFQEKLDWAKDVGFSGSLIWALDQGKLSRASRAYKPSILLSC
jgi:GH18 family chitinase